MSRTREWVAGISIVLATLLFILIFASLGVQRADGDEYIQEGHGEKVAVIHLLGPIYSSDRMVRQFKYFGERDDIRAIIFRIDSPGGGVAASQEIYEAVKAVRDGSKPVVASMASVAASGGYYVACGCDSIVANPGTTTGSIGVIAQFVTAQELLSKIGVKVETVKSGPYKDTGSYHRDFSTADRRYLQSWVDDAYAQFVDVVATERRLTPETVRTLADGRVYTGRQAFENGLIDRLGDFQAAVDLAADLAGIEGEPALVQIRRREPNLLDLLFQETEALIRGTSGMALLYRMP